MSPTWKIGVEIELLAPRGGSRRDLAEALAAEAGGGVRRVLVPHSEPSLVPGQPVFEGLSLGFLVTDAAGAVVCKLVDDVTIVDDLERTAPPRPGWWRVVGDDGRLLRLCARWADAEAELPGAIARFAALFGSRVEAAGEGVWRVADEAGASLVLAASLPGERERPCEIVTPPYEADHEARLERLLRTARRLGFGVPVEGAVHLHFDGARLASARAMGRLVRWWAEHGDAVKREVGTNPRCRRLGPHAPAMVEVARSEGFDDLPWASAVRLLLDAGATKYCDLNLVNLLRDVKGKRTVEVRVLPSGLEAGPIVAAMNRFEALFEDLIADQARSTPA